MIRARHAVKLAWTKLRVRPVRLGVLLITMSIMFAGLVFTALLMSGIVGSLKSFGSEGLGGRYIVEARPVTYGAYGNTALITQLQAKQEKLIAQKRSLADQLGVTYDSTSDDSLYYVEPGGNDASEALLTSSPLGTAALEAQNKAIPNTSFMSFTKQATQAGATHIYRSNDGFDGSHGAGNTAPTVTVLVDHKEDYSQSDLASLNGFVEQSTPHHSPPDLHLVFCSAAAA